MNRRKFLKFLSIATGGLIIVNKVIASSTLPKYKIGVDVANEKDSTIIMESTKLGNDWFYREYHKSAEDFNWWLKNHTKINQLRSNYLVNDKSENIISFFK